MYKTEKIRLRYNPIDIMQFLSKHEIEDLKKYRTSFQSIAHAHYLIKKMLKLNYKRRTISLSPSGKPFIKGVDYNISYSYKKNIVFAGYSDQKFGVNVQVFDRNIDFERYSHMVLQNIEFKVLDEFSRDNDISKKKGLIVFWAAKEAYFKAKDIKMRPKEITILGYDKDKLHFDLHCDCNYEIEKDFVFCSVSCN